MASIKSYKLKNGQERWEYFVSNGRNNGTGRQQKIHKRGFRTHKEALKAAKIIEGQIASEEFVKENSQKMTISKFMNIWINEYKNNVKEGSRIVYRDAIRMYIDPYIGNYQLNKYKPADHQKFINSLFTNKELGKNKNGLSYNTVKIVNAALSNAFKKAQKLGYVKSNPTYLVEFPLDKVKEKTNKEKKLEFYTLEQENLFLDTARNFDDFMWYVFFLIIFDLGLRKGEVMALRWFNFDFRDNILTFDKQRLYRKEQPGQVILDDVKTDAGKRSLKMTNRVRNSVLELYSINYDLTSNVLPMTNSNQDFLFINHRGKNVGLPIRQRSVDTAWHRIIQKANLPKIRIHDGRHTNAARLRQAGVPLEDIKDMLGHKNVKTTEIYAHVSAEVKERAVNKLELYQMQHKKSGN
ncbi:site-specific integrase [Enterococcus faecalis]|uniref:site-specific integrase n=1 Tax=Enterococcus faecalis TaxID=1351 RepID=UPI000A198B2C|nr:site-specific integrase [Enterococcus faecalis]OSH07832.1 integrase [Enterococcus faecalis]